MAIAITFFRSANDRLFSDHGRQNVQIARRQGKIIIRPTDQQTNVRVTMRRSERRAWIDDETAAQVGLSDEIGRRFRLKRVKLGRQLWFELRPHSTTDQPLRTQPGQPNPEPLVSVNSK